MSAPTRFSPSNPRTIARSSRLVSAAGLGCSGGRRMRRIEHVDVDGDVQGVAADRAPQLLDDVGHRPVFEFRTVNDREPEVGVGDQVLGV